MAATFSFKIGEKEYPCPSRFRLIDWVLIAEVSGLTSNEFMEEAP